MLSERTKRNGNVKELEIFDYFQIDSNLPKYRKEKTDNYNDDTPMASPSIVVGGNTVWANTPTNEQWDGDKPRVSLKVRIGRWLLKPKKNASTQEEVKVKKITIVEFFTKLTTSFEELTPIAEIAEYYQAALIQANVMGQVALVQKLKDLVEVVRGEAHLIAMGLKKYVTEEQIIDFYDLVGEDKNLKLTWIRNFGRIIPEDVYLAKKEVDDRKIFDNYVVLHYDPQNNGKEMTKEEKEYKKDPILFGVIKDSRKLYYVADWKDEYCDLTLEKMFEELGEKVLKINNKSVKTFIDKVKA